ncbi:MAG TPA: hypothetical protein VLW17_05285 [Thermoanaerobaculaceae bacterium]|nr:hypothetical protein [Thermoanaerobaculaceae bacterium]
MTAIRSLPRALVAVLAGNAIYFALLFRHLPDWLRHRPFALDTGLLFDFVICLAIFLALGRVRGIGAAPRPPS